MCNETLEEKYNKLVAESAETKAYIDRLAMSMHEKFFKKESPLFELLDTSDGVVSQIDNMMVGISTHTIELQKEMIDLRMHAADLTVEANDNLNTIRIKNMSLAVLSNTIVKLKVDVQELTAAMGEHD